MIVGLEIKQKRSIHPIRWTIYFVIIVFLAVSAYYSYRWFMTGELPIVKAANLGMQKVDETPVTEAQVKTHSVPSNNPRYISIPAIGVSQTRVFGVGVNKNNILDAPNNINDAVWYNKSATPGSGFGAVLIDAHNGGYTKDGVFVDLYKLAKGDEVQLERGDGKLMRYRVVSNDTMSLDDVNTYGMKNMMMSVDANKEGLSLITCAGNYVPRLGQFDKRVMIRAVAE